MTYFQIVSFILPLISALSQAAIVPATPNAKASPTAQNGRYAEITIRGAAAERIFRALSDAKESRGNLGQVMRIGKQLSCSQSADSQTLCKFHVRTNHYQLDNDNAGNLSSLRRGDSASRSAFPSPRVSPYRWNTPIEFSVEALADSAQTQLGRRIFALRLDQLPGGETALPLPRNDFTCQLSPRGDSTACLIYFDSDGHLSKLARLVAGP